MAERKTGQSTVQDTNAAGQYVGSHEGTTYVGAEKSAADIEAAKAETKYNPVASSKEKDAEYVQKKMGGLGAVAAAMAAKKKKAATAATQAEALEKK